MASRPDVQVFAEIGMIDQRGATRDAARHRVQLGLLIRARLLRPQAGEVVEIMKRIAHDRFSMKDLSAVLARWQRSMAALVEMPSACPISV